MGGCFGEIYLLLESRLQIWKGLVISIRGDGPRRASVWDSGVWTLWSLGTSIARGGIICVESISFNDTPLTVAQVEQSWNTFQLDGCEKKFSFVGIRMLFCLDFDIM